MMKDPYLYPHTDIYREGNKKEPDLMQQKDESVRLYIGIAQSGMSMGKTNPLK